MARRFVRNHRVFIAVCLVLATVVVGRIATTEAQTQTQTLTCYGGFGEEVAPPILLTSLSTIENPVIPKDPVTGAPQLRADLAEFVANLPAAIRLGKALFWDMQAGSDNKVACATCHFNAGADVRTRNQFHPGANGQWDQAGFAPNADLWPGAYPFTVLDLSLPNRIASDTDNISGSQGIRMATFGGIGKSGAELTTPVADPVFSLGGTNVRQVTRRQPPAIINAVFNHRNIHIGAAQAEFNGVNPLGDRDTNARVWFVSPLGPTQIDIHIKNASLASQAVGPAMNTVEMSAIGRTFPDLGKKMLSVKPLALQKVDPTDSVLGPMADPTKGLTTTYTAMIQAAFKPKWWNTTKTVRVGAKSYTMMQANFSLFWGLSLMLYQATLVADQSPMDQYLRYRSVIGGTPNPAILEQVVARIQQDWPSELGPVSVSNILNGLSLFELPPPPAPGPNGVGCMLCHVGAETTSASSRNLNHGIEPNDIAFVNSGFDQRMERMWWRIPPLTAGTDRVTLDPLAWTVTESNTWTPAIPPADVPLAVYDAGYYNIGVRPTAEDIGTGGSDPFGLKWSTVKMLQQTMTTSTVVKVPGAGLNCGATLVTNSSGFPLLSGALRKTERALVDGSFKVPGVRNAEFTGPYFHNGGKATLMQLIEFYDDGGDFIGNEALAPLIRPLGMDEAELADLVAFLMAMSDERVRLQKAPFDHPQLFVPNGDSVPGTDNMMEIPAVGAGGGIQVQRFLNLNPFSK
jgi:cytochrome c peroxidase